MSTLQLIRGGRDLEARIQIAQLRKLVSDLFEPNKMLYWFDMFVCAFGGYSLFYFAYAAYPNLLLSGSLLIAASLFLYRGMLFIHEIAHFRKDSVPGFDTAWNIIFGLPFFTPSYMYQGVHLDHHSKLVYGTAEDGEYVPFAVEGRKRILLYFSTVIFSPFLLYIRYAFIAPLSVFIPSFRKIVLTQLSSLVIDFEYVRGELKPSELKAIAWQEPLASVYGITLTAAFVFGVLPITFLPFIYCLKVLMFSYNTVRTVAAHRYANPGTAVELVEQLEDSVNIVSNSWIDRLICPVGLRFHALHHLFPTMPYHALDKAHARIIANIPKDSLYHRVNEPSLAAALKTLWRASKLRDKEDKPSEKTSLVPQFTQSKRLGTALTRKKQPEPDPS